MALFYFMDKNALLVIDVQRYFFSPASGAYINNSESVLKRINKVVRFFSEKNCLIVMTKFISPEKESMMKNKWKRMPSPYESEFADELFIPRNTVVVEKKSYSSFKNTNLLEILEKNKIKRIFFAGAMTHLCVESTVRDSFENGYLSSVIRDCCTSSRPEMHRFSIKIMKHGFSKITSSGEVLNENL